MFDKKTTYFDKCFQPTTKMNAFSELYTVNVILPFGCFLVKSSHSYMEQ